jgi:chorismate synthase
MNGNTFGTLFKFTSWGESHGPALGCVVDGCPSGLSLTESDFALAIAARQGGQSSFTTPRKEVDQVLIESGVFAGRTTGAPIALRVLNQNTNSQDYAAFANTPRPGHADFAIRQKQGIYDWRGGGRLSARETVARVAAGVIAQKILSHFGIECLAFVTKVANLELKTFPWHSADSETITNQWWSQIQTLRQQNPLKIPSANTADFLKLVNDAQSEGDSLGGAVECWVKGIPAGLGEPTFDKTQALLGHALLSLPAAVGFEAGGGIAHAEKSGSQIRDSISKLGVEGNRHGGLLGGMTTGNPLRMRVHFHAPTSVAAPVEAFNYSTGKTETISVTGRHDSFPLPRAVPMVEAMVQIVLVDLLARQGLLPANLSK